MSQRKGSDLKRFAPVPKPRRSYSRRHSPALVIICQAEKRKKKEEEEEGGRNNAKIKLQCFRFCVEVVLSSRFFIAEDTGCPKSSEAEAYAIVDANQVN